MSKKVVKVTGAFKCPECERVFNRAPELGNHRRGAHGIEGSSSGSIAARKARAAKKLAAVVITVEPIPAKQEVVAIEKRKYKKRETGYGQREAEISNEGSKETGEGNNNGISEITLAIALGRFQGLCSAMAYEFNIPSKMFTAQLAALIYATQVR
jgi:uncharacterized C2H2 Zn-finger protein